MVEKSKSRFGSIFQNIAQHFVSSEKDKPGTKLIIFENIEYIVNQHEENRSIVPDFQKLIEELLEYDQELHILLTSSVTSYRYAPFKPSVDGKEMKIIQTKNLNKKDIAELFLKKNLPVQNWLLDFILDQTNGVYGLVRTWIIFVEKKYSSYDQIARLRHLIASDINSVLEEYSVTTVIPGSLDYLRYGMMTGEEEFLKFLQSHTQNNIITCLQVNDNIVGMSREYRSNFNNEFFNFLVELQKEKVQNYNGISKPIVDWTEQTLEIDTVLSWLQEYGFIGIENGKVVWLAKTMSKFISWL